VNHLPGSAFGGMSRHPSTRAARKYLRVPSTAPGEPDPSTNNTTTTSAGICSGGTNATRSPERRKGTGLAWMADGINHTEPAMFNQQFSPTFQWLVDERYGPVYRRRMALAFQIT
jgi:hypothetical protein